MPRFNDLPQPTPIDIQQPPALDEQTYDHLFDPLHNGGSVAEAAVRPPETPLPGIITPEERAQIDASLRERTPQGDLTKAQIGRMAIDRGPVTPEQIKFINEARAAGIHAPTV